MAIIISSAYQLGAVQADGRERVLEMHVTDDGQVIKFEYLAGDTIDKDLVLSERAARVNAELAARAAALAEAQNGAVGYTKYQFRQRFTETERKLIDEFNGGGYLASVQLSQEQKDAIGLALADYAVTDAIHLDNPTVIATVNLYESLGLIGADRAAEILNG